MLSSPCLCPCAVESVREAVGRRVKLTLRRKIQLEVKGDKVENRVLVSESCSEHERGPWSLRLGSVEEVDDVIAQIGSCIQRICPASSPVKLMRKLNLKPPERLTGLQAVWNEQSSADLGPCGGFSHQYWCVCDSLGLPYREEVQWDVDTIYLSQDTRELNLQDFVHLENRDLVAIIAVLEYNQWFTKLSTKDYKLSTDVCDQIFRVVARSSRLEELVLDNAGLKSDFAQKLAGALSHNPSCTLHTLSLSNNSLEDKGYTHPHKDTHLKQCLCCLYRAGHLCRGYLFSYSCSPKPLNRFTNTHLRSSALCTFLDFKLPSLICFVCRSLLLGLGCNPNLSDVSLDLSSCELRSGGSQILEGCIAEIPNISSLDISDNSLDMDLTTLLVWLAKNRSIRHLSLGKNFNNIKSKNVAQVLDNLVHMIQEEETPLTSLSLADSKLKGDLSIILNALGSNSSLIKLDISGNSMGDMGAKILAKALQINTKLRTLIWDRNNVSPQGLQDVAAALEKNYTIRFMPVPIMDAAQALKANPDKTEDALLKMEQYLLRNHETRKYLQEQAYRLQQGIVTTTTQQMMDTMCVRVQDHLNSLRFSEANSVQEDMKLAENLMKDAKNSKTLLPNLYHLKSRESRVAFVAAIQDKLESMAGEVASVMDEQLQTMLVSMVDAAEGLCPHVMKRSGLRQELLKAGLGRMTVPRSFVTNTLLEQSGVDIINKISEVKLGVASILSDRIVDEILESLSSSQHALADHLIRKEHPLLRHEPQMELEVVDETVLQPENHEHSQKQDQDKKPRVNDVDPCMMTPKSKRKSILVRMLRPISVAFEMEFDLDKALEEVPIHVEDPPLPSPPPQASDRMSYYGNSVYLGELPPLEHKTLENCTKSRPKPKKRTKPSRAPVSVHKEIISAPHEAEQNNPMGNLDEGLDDFFSRTVVKLSFRSVPSIATPESGDKKRESRKSGFFNLIKAKATLTEEAPPTSPTLPAKSPAVPEHHQEMENKENPEKKESPPKKENTEKKENPYMHRHIGVPVMGKDLLAEMKARQERTRQDKMAEKKVEKSDVHPAVSSDPEDSKPEPIPRSKPPSVFLKPVPPHAAKAPLVSRPSGPLSPTSPRPCSIAVPGKIETDNYSLQPSFRPLL
uniref:CARMIL C-terminal domain-containing protein n=1 Tax=Fundulus heteroclitus TaxID=8078 RepID=A0A3Q2PG90_FUNHE